MRRAGAVFCALVLASLAVSCRSEVDVSSGEAERAELETAAAAKGKDPDRSPENPSKPSTVDNIRRAGDQGEKGYALNCPDGFEMAGISGRRGPGVDGLQILCAKSSAPLRQTWTSEYVGGSAGAKAFDLKCPEEFVVRSLIVNADQVIRGLQIVCFTKSSQTWTSPHAGEAGGKRYALKCDGSMVSGLKGTAGSVLLSVEVVCSDATVVLEQPPPIAIQETNPGRSYTLKRTEVEDLLDNPLKIGSMPRISPVFKEGKTVGYRVTRLEGSLGIHLGLQNGDKIMSIDGAPIKSLDIRSHLSKGAVKVGVVRGDEELELIYTFE